MHQTVHFQRLQYCSTVLYHFVYNYTAGLVTTTNSLVYIELWFESQQHGCHIQWDRGRGGVSVFPCFFFPIGRIVDVHNTIVNEYSWTQCAWSRHYYHYYYYFVSDSSSITGTHFFGVLRVRKKKCQQHVVVVISFFFFWRVSFIYEYLRL